MLFRARRSLLSQMKLQSRDNIKNASACVDVRAEVHVDSASSTNQPALNASLNVCLNAEDSNIDPANRVSDVLKLTVEHLRNLIKEY